MGSNTFIFRLFVLKKSVNNTIEHRMRLVLVQKDSPVIFLHDPLLPHEGALSLEVDDLFIFGDKTDNCVAGVTSATIKSSFCRLCC